MASTALSLICNYATGLLVRATASSSLIARMMIMMICKRARVTALKARGAQAHHPHGGLRRQPPGWRHCVRHPWSATRVPVHVVFAIRMAIRRCEIFFTIWDGHMHPPKPRSPWPSGLAIQGGQHPARQLNPATKLQLRCSTYTLAPKIGHAWQIISPKLKSPDQGTGPIATIQWPWPLASAGSTGYSELLRGIRLVMRTDKSGAPTGPAGGAGHGPLRGWDEGAEQGGGKRGMCWLVTSTIVGLHAA